MMCYLTKKIFLHSRIPTFIVGVTARNIILEYVS